MKIRAKINEIETKWKFHKSSMSSRKDMPSTVTGWSVLWTGEMQDSRVSPLNLQIKNIFKKLHLYWTYIDCFLIIP
jgi:hypothetical protein